MLMYAYTAILSKTILMQYKMTFKDKRASYGVNGTPLDSQCVTGHVLGENEQQAKEHAIAEAKRQYPEERGYKDHGNVSVQYVPECVVVGGEQ